MRVIPTIQLRRSRSFHLLVALAGALLLIAADSATASRAATVSVEPEDLEFEMLALMNGERLAAGLTPLDVTSGVRQVALGRAIDMAANGYFAHVNPEGLDAERLLDAHGVERRLLGENIARTMTPSNYPAREIVRLVHHALMASEHHRENILDERFQRSGIGICTVEGRYYFAVVFID